MLIPSNGYIFTPPPQIHEFDSYVAATYGGE